MPLQPTCKASKDTEETRVALANLLGAFTSGDRERLSACYDDNVDWLFFAPASIFPFAGARHGKADVFKGFETLFQSYRITEYYIEAMLADGDWASTFSNGQMLQLATQRTIRIRTGNFYRFRDGRVIEYRGFTDSLDIAEQVLGRELDF